MGLVPRHLSRAARESEKEKEGDMVAHSPSSESRTRVTSHRRRLVADARPSPLLPIPPSSPTCRISGDDALVRIQTTVAAKIDVGSSK